MVETTAATLAKDGGVQGHIIHADMAYPDPVPLAETTPVQDVSTVDNAVAINEPTTAFLDSKLSSTPYQNPLNLSQAPLIELSDVPDFAVDAEAEAKIRAKCARFTEWCAREGILAPKLEYPSFFEGGLVGVRVTKPIEHREGFLYVPYKCLITVWKCLHDRELRDFYIENPKLFNRESCSDWE